MSGLRPNFDLSERYFYPDDKKFICEHIEEDGMTIRQFASEHKLSKSLSF